MINITTGPTSLTLRNTVTGSVLSLRYVTGKFELHSDIQATVDVKPMRAVQKYVKTLVTTGMEKRWAYNIRLKKAADLLNEVPADTFKKLANRLELTTAQQTGA